MNYLIPFITINSIVNLIIAFVWLNCYKPSDDKRFIKKSLSFMIILLFGLYGLGLIGLWYLCKNKVIQYFKERK